MTLGSSPDAAPSPETAPAKVHAAREGDATMPHGQKSRGRVVRATGAKGEVIQLGTGWHARIRVASGKRKGFTLASCRTEEQAQERASAMTQISIRLRRAGHEAADVERILDEAARARHGRAWEAVIAFVDSLCGGELEQVRTDTVPTFADFIKDWTSGKLAELYPDHVQVKASSDRDADLARIYISREIGHLRLDQIRLDHVDLVMARIADNAPKRGRRRKGGKSHAMTEVEAEARNAAPSSGTRRHIAQVMRRALALAVYPARFIKTSPVPRGWLPRVKDVKATSYLYPSEDAALAASDVPLCRRVLWTFLAREGLRGPSEALALRWRHVDLTRGSIRLEDNKTHDHGRTWALNPGVVRGLLAWKRLTPGCTGPDDRIFVDEGGNAPSAAMLARLLRDDLHRAGVTRPELFEKTKTRVPLKAHSLRATFVTIALALGKSETFCMDRGGWKTSGQLHGYRRRARSHAELGLGDLLPLDEAIPEFRAPRSPADRPEGDGEGGSAAIVQQEIPEASQTSQTPQILAQILDPLIGVRIPAPEPDLGAISGAIEQRPPLSVSPRAAAVADLTRHVAALSAAGDLAAARALHGAIGKLLEDGGDATKVLDLSEERRKRER